MMKRPNFRVWWVSKWRMFFWQIRVDLNKIKEGDTLSNKFLYIEKEINDLNEEKWYFKFIFPVFLLLS